MTIIWILVNCNSIKEADAIGNAALKQRLISCFDIFPRTKTSYFWPPQQGKIESAKGCLLIMETLPRYFKRVENLVKTIHRDQLPFIGSLDIKNVSAKYVQWLSHELKK